VGSQCRPPALSKELFVGTSACTRCGSTTHFWRDCEEVKDPEEKQLQLVYRQRANLRKQNAVEGSGQSESAVVEDGVVNCPATILPGELRRPACASMQVDACMLVRPLPKDMRPRQLKVQLREALKSFGVERIQVASTAGGFCRGYATVKLESTSAVDRALEAWAQGIAIDHRNVARSSNPVHTTGAESSEGGAAECAVLIAHASRCVGGKVDDLFPFLDFVARKQLHIDDVALYSTVDQALGMDVADLVSLFVAVGGQGRVSDDRVTLADACACCGGCSLAFAHTFGHVHAIEVDEQRCQHLRHNVNVSGLSSTITVHCGDGAQLLGTLSEDVAFLDPPWGGRAYIHNEILHDLPLGDASLVDILKKLAPSTVSLAILRLPQNFDTDALAAALSGPSEAWVCDVSSGHENRPWPFSFLFGSSVIILVGFPRCKGGAAKRLRFDVATLDATIAKLNAWNLQRARQHHPRFYDWEAARWVPLSRWKGCKPYDKEQDTLLDQ